MVLMPASFYRTVLTAVFISVFCVSCEDDLKLLPESTANESISNEWQAVSPGLEMRRLSPNGDEAAKRSQKFVRLESAETGIEFYNQLNRENTKNYLLSGAGLAVVGCENETTLCDFASPALTSVKFDGETVGYTAADLLDRLMQGESVAPDPVLIPPKGIEVRASSDEYVIEDPVVLRCVKLIRKHAFEGISVAEIVKVLGVSRSTLERRMKSSLQRGTKQEILRVQFREVNRLLRNTDLTIETISELTGFTHAHYLQTSYRERYKITPGAYRNKK
ncbi:MAG: AraC-like DNA-binding protein [Verrucomicrobiales bacterium]|jgi:AraC-like DNA-binding protein